MILSGREPLDQDDDYIMFSKNENVEEFTLKMVQTFMKKVESTLQSLRFDAMSTTFVENPRKRKCWELFECETVKMDHGPCVAGCDESTRRKTDCGHYLCLRCHQNIKWVSGHKPCPVCRESIEEYDEYRVNFFHCVINCRFVKFLTLLHTTWSGHHNKKSFCAASTWRAIHWQNIIENSSKYIRGSTSASAVTTQPFLAQNLISITDACISLFCGILGSIQMFMKVDTKIHQYVICAHEFKKLSYRISRELSVERDVRSNNGKEVLNNAFNEFNSIIDKMETKEKRTREWLMLPEIRAERLHDYEYRKSRSMFTSDGW